MDGIVTRKVEPTTPLEVEYALTPLGRSLLKPIGALAARAAENRITVSEARAKFDKRRESTTAQQGGLQAKTR